MVAILLVANRKQQWRGLKALPAAAGPAEAKPQAWYFHSNGDAQRFTTTGSLTTTAPAGAEAADQYLYDPKNPPPNWMSFEQMQLFEDVQNFPYDFKDIESRPDVVKFTSAPLDQDLTIAGRCHGRTLRVHRRARHRLVGPPR